MNTARRKQDWTNCDPEEVEERDGDRGRDSITTCRGGRESKGRREKLRRRKKEGQKGSEKDRRGQRRGKRDKDQDRKTHTQRDRKRDEDRQTEKESKQLWN